MKKWADYLITGVRYNSDEEFIVYVEIREDKGDKVGNPENYPRESIISSIESGITFITSISKQNEKNERVWVKGAPVDIVIINNKKYLKTERNQTTKDNLGNLPLI